MKRVWKILDDFFYYNLGKCYGMERRWKIIAWLDKIEYLISHNISNFFRKLYEKDVL